MITQQELKESYLYDETTGAFTWARNPKRGNIGDIVGSINSKNGYMVINIKNKVYSCHRLAWLYMTGSFPIFQIDHKDQNRSNNIWSNLREVTNQINSQNSGMLSNNTSGVKGVSFHKASGKYRARINVNGKTKSLGYFNTTEEAKVARELAKKEYNYGPNHS